MTNFGQYLKVVQYIITPIGVTKPQPSMTFLTDATWPAGLHTIFDICRQEFPPLERVENRYYGPYTKLLTYCFPDSFDFFVAPQAPPSEFPFCDTVDSIVYLVVFDARRRPVLMAEIKDDGWANEAGLRLKADDQMRQRYDSMLRNCPLPRLWGLSLLGTSLRVYAGEVATGELEPAFVGRPSPSNRILPYDFLEGGWNLNIDILSQEGFNKMKEIVGEIIRSAAALERV
ncbi:hypothetical protein JOM56_012563 [Amanita muscaria]